VPASAIRVGSVAGCVVGVVGDTGCFALLPL